MKFYAVTCKHGHHGTKKWVPITFAVVADAAIDACDCAKMYPGVKHDALVLKCEEITYETFSEYSKKSAYERAKIK